MKREEVEQAAQALGVDPSVVRFARNVANDRAARQRKHRYADPRKVKRKQQRQSRKRNR